MTSRLALRCIAGLLLLIITSAQAPPPVVGPCMNGQVCDSMVKAAGATSPRHTSDMAADTYNVKAFGAHGDTQVDYNGTITMTVGSNTLTSTDAVFQAGDVGKKIYIPTAGPTAATGAVGAVTVTSPGTGYIGTAPIVTLGGTGGGSGAYVYSMLGLNSATVLTGGAGCTTGSQTFALVNPGAGPNGGTPTVSGTVAGGVLSGPLTVTSAGRLSQLWITAGTQLAGGGCTTFPTITPDYGVSLVGSPRSGGGAGYPLSGVTATVPGNATLGAVTVTPTTSTLVSTITAVTSANRITLADTAPTNLNAPVEVVWGHPDSAAIQAAVTAALAGQPQMSTPPRSGITNLRKVYLPAGTYLADAQVAQSLGQLPLKIAIAGDGIDVTNVIVPGATNQGGFLSLQTTTHDVSVTIRDMTVLAQDYVAGTAIAVSAPPQGAGAYQGLFENLYISPLQAWTATAADMFGGGLAATGIYRPKISHVIVSTAFGPGINGDPFYFSDGWYGWKMKVAIDVSDDYTPFVSDATVFGAIGLNSTQTTSPGGEALYVNNSNLSGKIGILRSSGDLEPQATITNSEVAYRDYGVDFTGVKYVFAANTLFFNGDNSCYTTAPVPSDIYLSASGAATITGNQFEHAGCRTQRVAVYQPSAGVTASYINVTGNDFGGPMLNAIRVDAALTNLVLAANSYGGLGTTGKALNLNPNIAYTYTDYNSANNTVSSPFSTNSIIQGYVDGTNGPAVTFQKGRGGAVGPTAILSNDTVGNLNFKGYDGANYLTAAQIIGKSSGTVGPGAIGGLMDFVTNGGFRLRINDSGQLLVGPSINKLLADQNGIIYDQTYQWVAPTTGQTIVIPDTADIQLLEPAGTLAALTVTLPTCSNSYPGKWVKFSTTQIITALTVNATAGAIAAGAPTTLAAGQKAAFLCRGAQTKWYPM